MHKIFTSVKCEKGQGVLEYVIIASLVGIFCLGAVTAFRDKLEDRINLMKEKIVEYIPR